MPSSPIPKESLIGLARELSERPLEELPEDPGTPKKKSHAEEKPWWPDLSEDGMKIFTSTHKYGLAHGERGSGKTIAILHKLVRHCYDNNTALAIVAVIVKTTATSGGSWEKLIHMVLPMWAKGIGLHGDGPNGEFMERRDTEQNRIIWISSHDGGWSKVMLKSMTHDQQIQSRMKGAEPSFFFFDELTETDIAETEYFDVPIQQLGRRVGYQGRSIDHQPFWGACNPADQGEDHWVFKTFFIKENQENPDDFLTIHIKMEDNRWMEDRESYISRVKQSCRGDPAKIARLLHGKWVKQPSGKGIFAQHFSRNKHVRGDLARKRRVLPSTDYDIEVGYDLGTANSCISVEQRVGDRSWRVLDEIVIIGRPTPLRDVALVLLRRMNWWCAVMKHEFHFNHISDNSAFNQRRQDGSYDYRVVEQTIANELINFPERYPALTIKGIKVVAAPKPHGSVAARVRGVISRLQHSELIVSALATDHIDMFMLLEQEEEKGRGYTAMLPYTPKKTLAGHIHIFDAMSYPMYHYDLGGTGSPIIKDVAKTEMLDLHI
jgi:hypothetical protein